MFENNPDVRSRLENYRGFVMWDMLPELDTDHLFDQIEGHISGQRLNLILASHLLSIEAFLKAVA